MMDLGIREIWDSDTIIFRCGCHMLRWPWKDGRRAVRLDGCGRYEHYDDALALVDPLDLRWADEDGLMICYDEREIPGEFIFVH